MKKNTNTDTQSDSKATQGRLQRLVSFVDTSTLKRRLTMKRLERRIRAECEENFGYSPDGKDFDELLEERARLRAECKEHDPIWFAIYDDWEWDYAKTAPNSYIS